MIPPAPGAPPGAVLGSGPVPAPPDPLDCAVRILPAGSAIHRIHDIRFGPTEFNPGLGHSRFAPSSVRGVRVPTAYAASSLECALFETLFHDIEPNAPRKSVGLSTIGALQYSVIRLDRPVGLAALFSADLMRLGIERTQLIDTARTTYRDTQAWSPAIHEAATAPEGMIWTSRRYDEDRALILFGTRIAAGDLVPTRSVKLASDPDCLEVVHQLAQRAGVLIAR